MKPRIQRSVDLSSDVTGMFRRASSAETNMAVSIGSERKTKVIAEGKHDDDNDDDENDGTEIEIDTEVEIEVEKTKAIPIGSGLQAVRKVATLSAEKEKPMRTFPCFPGDGDLASLLIRLADQARYTIFNERKLDEVTMKSPFFTNLSPRFQIILLYRCIRALILPSKNSKNNDKMTHPYTATFFLDVTLHALLRTMVPGITQEIISQQENNSGFKQNAMRNDDSGGGGGDDDGDSEDEDCDAENFCKHRTFLLAFYELCTGISNPIDRDSTNLKQWLGLVDDVTLAIFNNTSPKLLTAMETSSHNIDDVLARMASATDGVNYEWKDIYFSDTILSDKQISSSSSLSVTKFNNNDESRGCLFWPRDQFTPEDLRFANLCLSALSFEDSSDASFFNPFPLASASGASQHDDGDGGGGGGLSGRDSEEEERIESIKQAVMLLQQSEDSANEAQAHAHAMVVAAEEAIATAGSRGERRDKETAESGGGGRNGVRSGSSSKKSKERQAKLKDKLAYAQKQESRALAIREEQCRDLIQAITLLLHAVSQQSHHGWIWVWEQHGGRHQHDFALRLEAIEQARPYLSCTDFIFEMAGEGLWDYMMFAHSLCVTPLYLWDNLE
eukprot:CAMPEP_0114342258 /NCGR_PEP_ID=MMETSP0101-20121206/9661_1 /TAXON_ID=38822 ORGANISM="Pteridomonas danica, Strain PT" /NCGR_SAMPLE_ID=MMETSP0101 /ASSEMBLY_ACC=CAM_ASM_000211 /LENGTH=614 /DNA_ID=CAMNT_0001476269 /DNA_START=15 /DNA_END=1859 /DNA_ORIENTATION=-